MAILSSLLSISEPKGFWITIIKAFEAFAKNYVLAIVLITLILRLLWSGVELIMKYNQQYMNKKNAEMKPEMDKLEAKYANQPDVLQQKKNELMKKHLGKSQMGSCLIMLLTQGLNILIFFTLFTGLNSIAAYKNSVNYDNLKYTYVNCLSVTDAFLEDDTTTLTYDEKLDYFADYENLSFVIRSVEQEQPVEGEEGKTEKVTKKYVDLVYTETNAQEEKVENVLYTIEFKDEKAFTTTKIVEPETPETEEPEVPTDPEVEVTATEGGEGTENQPGQEGEEPETIEVTNENIITLIQKYFPVYLEGEEEGSKEIIIDTTIVKDKDGNVVKDEEGNDVVEYLYLSTAIQNVAIEKVGETYDANKDSFLWIENIWLPDTPFNKSIVSYNKLQGLIGKKNIEEGEKTVYDAFMPDLKEVRDETNGYLLLPLISLIATVISMMIPDWYNKYKAVKKEMKDKNLEGSWFENYKKLKPTFPKKKGGVLKFILPAIILLFGLFYNAVFCVYTLIGQMVSMLLNVPQLMIIDAITAKKQKKEDANKITIDYARKF